MTGTLPLSHRTALVLLMLSLEPQSVPALAKRLALGGEFLADPEVRAQLQKLTTRGLVRQVANGRAPTYALASGAQVDEALDLAWRARHALPVGAT